MIYIKYNTLKEFAHKVSWEGGVLNAMYTSMYMDYGLRAEDIPDDGSEDSQKLFTLWNEASAFPRLLDEIEAILDKYRD